MNITDEYEMRNRVNNAVNEDSPTNNFVDWYRLIERQVTPYFRAPYESEGVPQHEDENEGWVEVEAHSAPTRNRHRPVDVAVGVRSPDEQPDVDGEEDAVENDFSHVVAQVRRRQISRPVAVATFLLWRRFQPVCSTVTT